MESIIAILEIKKRVRGLLSSLNKVKTHCKVNLTFQSKKTPNFKVVLEW